MLYITTSDKVSDKGYDKDSITVNTTINNSNV